LGGRGRLRRPLNRWGRAGVLDPRAARKSEPAVAPIPFRPEVEEGGGSHSRGPRVSGCGRGQRG
jgi:hypothetical protein